MFSKLSERHYFPTAMCTVVFLGDLPTLLFLIQHISKCPQIAQAVGWIFRREPFCYKAAG